MTKRSSVGEAAVAEINGVEEYESSSRGSRFTLIQNAVGLSSTRRTFSRQTFIDGLRDLSRGLVIHPDNRSAIQYMHTFLPPSLSVFTISTRSSFHLINNCTSINCFTTNQYSISTNPVKY